MNDGGAVVPVNGYVVAAMVLAAFLCWSLAAWAKHRERDAAWHQWKQLADRNRRLRTSDGGAPAPVARSEPPEPLRSSSDPPLRPQPALRPPSTRRPAAHP